MKIATILVASILLAGCASFTEPTNELRVTEYGADGSYFTASGVVGGCRLVAEGETSGCLRYDGEGCHYTSSDCERSQTGE